MDEQTIRAAREIDAVPILPRDCDGGLAADADSAPDFHPDERIGLADESPRDQLARLASQLSSINDQLKRLIPQLDSWGDHYHCCQLALELAYRLQAFDVCLAEEYYGGKTQPADRECYAALGITQQ